MHFTTKCTRVGCLSAELQEPPSSPHVSHTCHWYISRARGQSPSRSELRTTDVVAKVDQIGLRRGCRAQEGARLGSPSTSSACLVTGTRSAQWPTRGQTISTASPWHGLSSRSCSCVRHLSCHVSSRRRQFGQPAAVRLKPEGLEDEDEAWICTSGTCGPHVVSWAARGSQH